MKSLTRLVFLCFYKQNKCQKTLKAKEMERIINFSCLVAISSQLTNSCGNTIWKAAKNKGLKNHQLDITALNYCSCRRCIAQKPVNMKQGDIYAYPYHLQSTFMKDQQVKYTWSDVACKYHPWLEKVDHDLNKTMVPALPDMHAKAHSTSCQLTVFY